MSSVLESDYPVTEVAEHDGTAGWTFETLRIHLLSIMNEREKAHDKAISVALTAVKDSRSTVLALSLAVSTVVATIVALAAFFLRR